MKRKFEHSQGSEKTRRKDRDKPDICKARKEAWKELNSDGILTLEF